MKAKCNHCKYEWNYTGKTKYYCNCPRCYGKVNIRKLKELKEASGENPTSSTTIQDDKVKSV